MYTLDALLSFFLAAAVFAYMPGPSMLYAATQTIARGRRAGWMAAAGIHLGGYVHVLAAAAGLSVVFTAVPVLYAVVKVLGAIYLIWLGVQLIRSSSLVNIERAVAVPAEVNTRVLLDSAIVEILNPKTAIFYIAFLPQFTDLSVSLPIWAQLLLLGTVVNILFSSADIICVLLSSTVVRVLTESPGASQLARRIGGGILMGLGIHLFFSRQ